jgi:hypothetical protein
MKYIFIFVTIVLISFEIFGCGIRIHSREIIDYRKFDGHIRQSTDGKFERVSGSNIVLEIFQFTEPGFGSTGWGGSSLFIEANPMTFEVNKTISYPGGDITLLHYSDYHHQDILRDNFEGNLRIVSVTDTSIVADLDLKDLEFRNTYKIKATFVKKNVLDYKEMLAF